MTDTLDVSVTRDLPVSRRSVRSDREVLRALAVAGGLGWSVLFIVVGLYYDLQMFADGSIFSYSVAVEDGWQFHWHNIASRLFVLVFCHLPAEAYVRLTDDAHGAIVVYGFLFFGAPLLGLALTYALDRSRRGLVFGYACASTACLCPLVYGFPTEMWVAHAAFWPALAAAHYARGRAAPAIVFATLLALAFTHEGALIFAAAILATVLLRGHRDPALARAVKAFALVMAIWIWIRIAVPPDDYISRVLASAALNFIDVTSLLLDPMRLLLVALLGYLAALLALRPARHAWAHLGAALIVSVAYIAFELIANTEVAGENRYFLRTALLVFTPVLGGIAAAFALAEGGTLRLPIPGLCAALALLARPAVIRGAAGALLVTATVHVMETERFVSAWQTYENAVRSLAMGSTSDPSLGDPRFVSANRLSNRLDGLVWASTTHFLSVVVAPALSPARLVVDPDANYFWLSCKTAAANAVADRAVPLLTRQLVRIHACLHRR